jgi:hypothetical protein
MLGLLHGEAGGWDELAIAVAAFGVLWLAVKLAGRKSAAQDDADADPEHPEAAQPEAVEATDSAELDHTPQRNR